MTDTWQTDAACRGMDPDIWFPGQSGDVKLPKSICATCPVSDPCQDHGLRHEAFGVWGGLTDRQRKRTRQRLGIRIESYGLPPGRSWSKAGCGTSAGYQRHIREGTPTCTLCKRAHADRKADDKARLRQKREAS